MRIIQCMQTRNTDYSKPRNGPVKGVVLHTTAANNPKLCRYVDNAAALGPNAFGNHWNKPTAGKSAHAFIGLDKDGKLAVAQCLPCTSVCRLAGKGSKGSFNSTHVQFEMCEDSRKNEAYYRLIFQLAEDYCVYLCQTLNLTAESIVGHYEAHALGYANNHADPQHWMKKYGDSMDKFRARVKARLLTAVPVEPEKPQPPAPPQVQQPWVKVRLKRPETLKALHRKAGDIIELPIEEYLLGVVPAEISNAPLEACKAQAVAARTYALELARTGAVVNDGEPHQAYRAVQAKDPRFYNAHNGVKQTAGQVLTYKGQLLDRAWYHDSNGGQMLQSGDVWSEDRPFLKRGPDPWTKASKKPKRGHGVGLSQQGAIWAAARAVGHHHLLAFYYPGAAVTADYGKGLEVLPAEPKVLYRATVKTLRPLSLNLWATPGRAYQTGVLIPRGAQVDVLGIEGSPWVLVRYREAINYVDGRYLAS